MSWADFFRGEAAARHAPALLSYLVARRWFRGKARTPTGAAIVDVVTVPCLDRHRAADAASSAKGSDDGSHELAHVVLLRVDYRDGEHETYLLPVAFCVGSAGDDIAREMPHAVVMKEVATGGTGGTSEVGVVHDALASGPFADALLDAVVHDRTYSGEHGELRPRRLDGFHKIARGDLRARLSQAEQTNSAVFYGDRVMMKVYRRLDQGTNPELEIGAFLANISPSLAPRPIASIDYGSRDGPRAEVALLQELVSNRGDGWSTTLETLRHILDAARSGGQVFSSDVDGAIAFASFFLPIRRLASRTAELHLALASSTGDAAFTPEPLTLRKQESMRDDARVLLTATLALLAPRVESLPARARPLAQQLVASSREIERRLDLVACSGIDAALTRIHGDFHLGQVLTVRRDDGDDFVIIDFEGEPGRSLDQRRAKNSPLRDVAGMLRSFHYAAASALRAHELRNGSAPDLDRWASAWTTWTARVFLERYFESARGGAFLPHDEAAARVLLEFFLLEKCIYEVGYELNNRPDWLEIPLRGLLELLSHTP